MTSPPLPPPGRGRPARFIAPWEMALKLLEDVPVIVSRTRAVHGLSLRQAAEEVGVSHQTLYRVERGEDYNVSTVGAILRWVARRNARSTT